MLAGYRAWHDLADCEVERLLTEGRASGILDQDLVARLAQTHRWVYIYAVVPLTLAVRRIRRAYIILIGGGIVVHYAIELADKLSGKRYHVEASMIDSAVSTVILSSFWLFQVMQIFRMANRRWTPLYEIVLEAFWPVAGVVEATTAVKVLVPSVPTLAALVVALSFLLATASLIAGCLWLLSIAHFRSLARIGRARSRADRIADILLDLLAEVHEQAQHPQTGPMDLVGSIGDTIEQLEKASPLALSPVLSDRVAMSKSTRDACLRVVAELRRIRERAVDAALTDQRAGIFEDLLRVLHIALDGRWADLPEPPTTLKRKPIIVVATRIVAPAFIVAFAIVLPRLPGVHHSPDLTGIQSALFIAAVTTLLGVSAEARKTISDAFIRATEI